jgi:hypothetical protein
LLQRYVAEHPVLNPLVSAHVRETNQPHNPPQTRTYFNKFLGAVRALAIEAEELMLQLERDLIDQLERQAKFDKAA